MSDLISRNALLDAMPKDDELLSVDVRRIIYESPIIDAEPVRHGRWKIDTVWTFNSFEPEIVEEKCFLCGRYVQRYRTQSPNNYCPNCGAKMDGGE